ncbi:D-alanyl-D-alanine carboxypeptidase [Candidatus Photodesmus blepharus]|uniref:serine-type D-Ala-D-Ala carboxypeptidase n=1 Tax=Candidatus Photodesmus blepharonis TaxID=1179155 RepID=A0A084CPI9_9GAMM|nr:serine hydrolase [Candidatus Photodesmus blepharus]KEY91718.1 D-alanyl-D-alanine carboxypeptidase [Candidatus Photodesmus blepharus]
MKKTTLIISFFTVFISICRIPETLAINPPIVIPDAPKIGAKGYVLIDYHSGKVLTEKEMHRKLSPASLTKIMTSYIIGQELVHGKISPEDNVVISQNAWSKNFPDSSKMFIEVGNKVKVKELNRGIIIQSGNDACVAMAEHIAGSEDAFVSLMNSWANSIGMTNTNFTNVHGLDDPKLYSTPYDMALLASALIRDLPKEYPIYSEKKFTYNGITQYNRNSLLWDKSMNVDGVKTGHTKNSGYNLLSSATEGEMRLIAVVMGSKSSNTRKFESKKLLSYGFRFFETVSPHKAGEALVQEKIWMGNEDTITLGVNQDTYVTLPRGQAKNLKASFILEKELEAPISKGDVVGKVYYQLDDKNIAEYSLLALKSVEEGGLFSCFWDYIVLIFKSFFHF